MTRSIAAMLAEAAKRFRAISDSPELDASLLLSQALGKPRSYLIAHADEAPPVHVQRRFEALAARRATGEPVAYIEGHREFWSLTLSVTPDVLIPRPETETLVERALEIIPPQADWHIADLGTGSGAIALSLGLERPGCRIIATDHSDATLAMAASNARCNAVTNVEFRQGDWYDALDGGQFDMIVSNPPYIAAGDSHLDAPSMQFEPQGALVSGNSGLESIEQITTDAPVHLRPGGWLLIEHGADQAVAVAALLQAAGFHAPQTDADLAGHPRMTFARLAPG